MSWSVFLPCSSQTPPRLPTLLHLQPLGPLVLWSQVPLLPLVLGRLQDLHGRDGTRVLLDVHVADLQRLPLLRDLPHSVDVHLRDTPLVVQSHIHVLLFTLEGVVRDVLAQVSFPAQTHHVLVYRVLIFRIRRNEGLDIAAFDSAQALC